MSNDVTTNPIAIRVFRLRDGRKIRTVTVSIWEPTPTGHDDGHKCRYQILGMGDEKARYAHGSNAIQALHLAIITAGGELYASREYAEGRLTFKYSFKGDLGLPVPKVLSDLPPAGATGL